MKYKMIKAITMSIAMVFTVNMASAIQVIFDGYTEIENPTFAHANGYIATFWWGWTDDSTQMTILGGAPMLDYYGEEWVGYWDYAAYVVPSIHENDTFWTEVRIFQPSSFTVTPPFYDPVENQTGYLTAPTPEELAREWDLLAGSAIVGVVKGSVTVDPYGLPTYGETNYADGIASQPRSDFPRSDAVPEPATYAALAGLAMVVFAMIRRRPIRD